MVKRKMGSNPITSQSLSVYYSEENSIYQDITNDTFEGEFVKVLPYSSIKSSILSVSENGVLSLIQSFVGVADDLVFDFTVISGDAVFIQIPIYLPFIRMRWVQDNGNPNNFSIETYATKYKKEFVLLNADAAGTQLVLEDDQVVKVLRSDDNSITFGGVDGYVDLSANGSNITLVDATVPTGDDHTIINDGLGPELKTKYIANNNNPTNGILVNDTVDRLSFTCLNPDQTVVLNDGTGISNTGTYPNFTITNTAPDQTVTLTEGAGVTISGTYPSFTVTTGQTGTGAGTVVINETNTGSVPITTGSNTTAYGSLFTNLNSTNAVVIGRNLNHGGNSPSNNITIGNSITLGSGSQPSQGNVIMTMYPGAQFVNNNIVAIGNSVTQSTANSGLGNNAVCIGGGAQFQENSVACGYNCKTGKRSVHIGANINGSGTISNDQRSVVVGYNACGTATGTAHNVILGYQAVSGGNITESVCIGHETNGAAGTKLGLTCIGHNQASGASPANYEVLIGHTCARSNVAGRLSFGANMETPHGSFAVPAANPEAYLKIDWNGTTYYIPAYTTVPT